MICLQIYLFFSNGKGFSPKNAYLSRKKAPPAHIALQDWSAADKERNRIISRLVTGMLIPVVNLKIAILLIYWIVVIPVVKEILRLRRLFTLYFIKETL